jgi:uncharacterized protein involved in exopolysaccharide biosynthesis
MHNNQNFLEEKLEKIEKQLVALSSNCRVDGVVDLRPIIEIIWAGKLWIFAFVAFFSVTAVACSFIMPNIYTAGGVYAKTQQEQGISNLAAQYGGLAAMAGIKLNAGESGDIEQAMELVKSWPFLDAVVEKYDMKPLIMGVKKWGEKDNQIIYDKRVYDPENKQWTRKPPKGGTPEPSSYEVYLEFSKMIDFTYEPNGALVKASVKHRVPELAKLWLDMLVFELNKHFQNRDLMRARQNIEYLTAKIQETNIAEMHSVFYSMIEAQTKTLMLAEVEEQYLLQVVVPPKIPERKSFPRRVLILLFAAVFGCFSGILFVLYRGLVTRF